MGIRVLLVEDDPAYVILVRHALERDPDLEPLKHADSLRRSFEVMAKLSVDVLLLDLNLPDSQGLDTVRSARERFPAIPVVVLTGHRADETGIEAVRLGAQDYLQKDRVEPETLCRVIRCALERSNLALQASATPVTGRLYESADLSEYYPEDYETFITTYRTLLERSIEERLYKITPQVPNLLRDLADELGIRRATPRDVVGVHLAGLKRAMDRAPQGRLQAVVEEGRILALHLMGHLASFYRSYYQGPPRKG